MDLYEHWVCLNCDSVDPPTFKGDEKACGPCADEGENGLLVKLVPERDLRGAVAESERLKRTLDTAHRDWRRQVEALEARIVCLTTTGGQ